MGQALEAVHKSLDLTHRIIELTPRSIQILILYRTLTIIKFVANNSIEFGFSTASHVVC